MILDGTLTATQMATVAICSKRSVKAVTFNLRRFSATKAPANRVRKRRSTTPPMLNMLRKHLGTREARSITGGNGTLPVGRVRRSRLNTQHQQNLEGGRLVEESCSADCEGRKADLRDFCIYKLTQFQSYHLVFIDKSSCDKRIGFRRTGWSPLSVAPVQVPKFHCDQRYQNLPAYTQDGTLLSQGFQRSTDSAVFKDYIEQLLSHCSR